MKCPKCGFNSFEFLDACKKCGNSFDSFKKSHRINPVIFQAGPGSPAASGEASSLASVSLEAAEAEAGPVAMEAPEVFSWEVPEDTAPPLREEEPFPGFSFQLPESTPDESADTGFSGFSFTDEPAAAGSHSSAEAPANDFYFQEDTDSEPVEFSWDAPVETPAPDPGTADRTPGPGNPEENVFSFNEITGSEPESFTLDAPAESPGSELENFDRMIDPGTLGDTGDESGASAVEGESGYFGTSEFTFAPEEATDEILLKEEEPAFSSDFTFAAEQVTEDIFQSGEEIVVKGAEKKTHVSLENFDKEFEMIFASDDGDETGKQN